MQNRINYMDEIKRIKSMLDNMEEENVSTKSHLRAMLNNLERTADEMASYISGYYDDTEIDNLRRINALGNSTEEYLSGLKKLLRLERISLICSTQTPDEKMYFLQEYAKYKENQKEVRLPKVR
jgi:hypothetical protein